MDMKVARNLKVTEDGPSIISRKHFAVNWRARVANMSIAFNSSRN